MVVKKSEKNLMGGGIHPPPPPCTSEGYDKNVSLLIKDLLVEV